MLTHAKSRSHAADRVSVTVRGNPVTTAVRSRVFRAQIVKTVRTKLGIYFVPRRWLVGLTTIAPFSLSSMLSFVVLKTQLTAERTAKCPRGRLVIHEEILEKNRLCTVL